MKRALFALTLLLVPGAARAGPWARPAGTVYAKASSRLLLGARYTDGRGETTPIPGYRELTNALSAELSLGSGVTLLAQWDVARWFRIDGETSRSLVRPGDPRAGVRYTALSFGRGALAFEGWLGVPVASGEVIAPLADEDGATIAELRAGPGQLDLTGRAELGWAWDAAWTSAAIGWVQRFGGYDGMLDWRAELGGRWWRLQGVLRLGGRHALDTGGAASVENPAGQSNGTSFTSTILETTFLASDRWQVGTSAQFSLAGLGVRSQARGPVFTLFIAFSG
ncbi:MAG: hypothetical protein RMA76_25510 [Deltaproteobacteria bacterium]|jgi:hypothetical protein